MFWTQTQEEKSPEKRHLNSDLSLANVWSWASLQTAVCAVKQSRLLFSKRRKILEPFTLGAPSGTRR
ncbi:mCG147945 [Mus musculus]|nr:mCG147945 [Mus musculus]